MVIYRLKSLRTLQIQNKSWNLIYEKHTYFERTLIMPLLKQTLYKSFEYYWIEVPWVGLWACNNCQSCSPSLAKVNRYNYNTIIGFCGWHICGYHKTPCSFQANITLLNESLSIFSIITIVAIQYQSSSTIMLKILCPFPSSVWVFWVVYNSAFLNHTRMELNLQFLILAVFCSHQIAFKLFHSLFRLATERNKCSRKYWCWLLTEQCLLKEGNFAHIASPPQTIKRCQFNTPCQICQCNLYNIFMLSLQQ